MRLDSRSSLARSDAIAGPRHSTFGLKATGRGLTLFQTSPAPSIATPSGTAKCDPAGATLPFSVPSLCNAVTLSPFRFVTQMSPALSIATAAGLMKFDPPGKVALQRPVVVQRGYASAPIAGVVRHPQNIQSIQSFFWPSQPCFGGCQGPDDSLSSVPSLARRPGSSRYRRAGDWVRRSEFTVGYAVPMRHWRCAEIEFMSYDGLEVVIH
jgi:hypothetical protein